MTWEKWEGLSRINIKIHNLAKTNYTVLFGFLTTNRFYHGKNTCMILQGGYGGSVAMARNVQGCILRFVFAKFTIFHRF